MKKEPPVECELQDLGTLPFDGSRLEAQLQDNHCGVAVLLVPSGVPSSKQAISGFEHNSPATSKKMWLSQTRGDFDVDTKSAKFTEGTGPNLYYSIDGISDQYTTCFHPGETWYLHIVNQKPDGSSSTNGASAGIGLKAYPPN